ncbi:MAG: LacI family transcriptional regulator, partial [bacterium]|nr:LacI family transcriptional regulator [bacterium]
LWPPLTTVRQPVRQMAAVALDRLMCALRSNEPSADASAEYVLGHVLIERESTAPPRNASRIAGEKPHQRSSHA